MNVIFLTLARIDNVEDRGIYQDLMRKFRDEGHQVFIVGPVERRVGLASSLEESKGVKILNVKTLNIQKTNVVEKGIGTLLLERQYKKAIKKYLSDVKFDLILYSTPPITFPKVIAYLKKQNPQAKTYLLLKDIFPQNAVDIGMMSKTGAKGVLYRFFRKKEIALYRASDFIGCMSPANVQFLLRHNDFIRKEQVEVAPNSIELQPELSLSAEYNKRRAERDYIRNKYNIPKDALVFIYGGNLGRPQGIDFLIKCLDANKNRTDCYFVVVGTGTELPRLLEWYKEADTNCTNGSRLNVKVMRGLPKEDYDMLVSSCDVGLIFLDYRFTIPNYPSRLLSYLENKMPVICATDKNTDIGRIAEENGYGYWCESVKPEDFTALVDKMLASDRKAMGEKGYQFLKENYLVEHTYNAIMKHFA